MTTRNAPRSPDELRRALAARARRHVVVALVDSGIAPSSFASKCAISGRTFWPEGTARNAGADKAHDEHGHGTRCAEVMVDLFDGVRILPCKVFGTKLDTSIQQVIAAIHWASNNGAEIICLCLSTPHDRFAPALYAACAYARRRGTWLIAAASNRHEASFPAQFDTVVGVESLVAQSPAVLYARTQHAFRFVAAGNRGEQSETFNSYAAARVAGLGAMLLAASARDSGDDLETHLVRYAEQVQALRRAESVL